MAWTAPRTWVVGETVTAALMNTHLRDNLTFLGSTHDHDGDSGDGATLSFSEYDYICIVDEKAQNTAGGTFTSGAWRTRDLNSEKADTGNHASVSSNQITLEAGTYRAFVTAAHFIVDNNALRLQNITDGTTILTGTNPTNYPGWPVIVGRFTLAAQKVIEVQHRCQTTRSTDGYGKAANFQVETYTIVQLIRES